VYVVCREHLEEAIDEFVDVYEMPPDIYKLNDITFTKWTAPATCDFCDKHPIYLVV